jgi:hypothetical protein
MTSDDRHLLRCFIVTHELRTGKRVTPETVLQLALAAYLERATAATPDGPIAPGAPAQRAAGWRSH